MILKLREIADYHVVELREDIPDWWMSSKHTIQDVDTWCEHAFGASDCWGSEPVTGWKRLDNQYFFTDQNKLNWFVLRWS